MTFDKNSNRTSDGVELRSKGETGSLNSIEKIDNNENFFS
jgi:hypothetical protein